MRYRVRRVGENTEALVSNNQLGEAWIKTHRWYQESKGNRAPPTKELNGTNLNPVRRLLQAASTGGRATTNPSATSKYCRRTSRRRGNCSGGTENLVDQDGRIICNEGGIPKVMSTGINQGERYGYRGVGKNGECNAGSVSGQEILEAMMWKIMVLIPKGGGGYIGIGLLEAIWKVCM